MRFIEARREHRSLVASEHYWSHRDGCLCRKSSPFTDQTLHPSQALGLPSVASEGVVLGPPASGREIALLGTPSVHGALWVVASRRWLGVLGDVTYRVVFFFSGVS